MSDVEPARDVIPVRRYPVLGGAAAWLLPLLAAALAAGAAAFQTFDVAIGAAALGWLAHRLTRSIVVEISPMGLTRGLLGPGTFRARTTVMGWGAIAEVHTAWCRPGDDLALETIVSDRQGRTIQLSTAMGLQSYWTCLAEIVRHALAARRTGMTDAVLADGPPARHDVVSAISTAAGLVLVLAAVVTMHALWAQGRSTLARDLERVGSATAPSASACHGASPRSVERAADRHRAVGDRCP